MYLERLSSSGLEDSPYFVPSGKFNTSPAGSDIQMPNCTMYAFCRAYEATDASKRYDIARKGGGFGNANKWFSESPLPKGNKLKTGSIACFDGVYGHVAFVERVIDDTHALISESQYDDDKSLRNYKYWNKRVVELEVGKATLNGVGPLQGFLYLDIDDKRTQIDGSEQIEILEDYVNVRATPNGNIARKGCYAPMGVYNILSRREVDGYMWYELDKNNWVREGSWLKYYSSDLMDDLKKIKEILSKWV